MALPQAAAVAESSHLGRFRSAGLVDGYHWGTIRKKAIIAWEAAHAAN